MGSPFSLVVAVYLSTRATSDPTKGLTYLPTIFLREAATHSHGNTLTSFSMFLGLGWGKFIMVLKNASEEGLFLETVWGRKPSKFRRILFFSSTVNR